MEHDKILLVEDDDDVREALAAFLEGAGYSIVEAANGEQALHKLRGSTAFCLILLDLMMPVMNGWDFRSQQLQDPDLAAIPVVVITADSSVATKPPDMGAVDYMVKPVDLDRLLEHVERYC